MKKIAALFSAALMTVLFTFGASAEESAPAGDAPILGDFMEKYGTYILLGAIGVFAVIAIIALIASHISSRKKYKKLMKAKKLLEEFQKGEKKSAKDAKEEKEEKETKESTPITSVERIIEKTEPVVVQPNNYYYYDYRYYNNGQEIPYGNGEYKELATEAIRVPERRLVEVPPVRRSSKGAIVPTPIKPTAPAIPVTPIAARDLQNAPVQAGEAETVVTIQDEKKAMRTKIAAAVAITAVGCHVLHKLSR